MPIANLPEFTPKHPQEYIVRRIIVFAVVAVLIIPALWCGLKIADGHVALGSVCLAAWLPVLLQILRILHVSGIIRVGISFPVVVVSSVVIAFVLIYVKVTQ